MTRAAVSSVLDSVAASMGGGVRQCASAEGVIGLPEGVAVSAAVHGDEWLVLRALDGPVGLDSPADALARNAAEPGPAKLVAVGCAAQLSARADIVLIDGLAPAARIREAIGGLLHLARDGERAADMDAAAGQQHDDEAEWGAIREHVTAAIGEAGWACHERSNLDVVVDLDVPGQFRQATVRPGHRTSIALRVDLVRVSQGADAVHRALAALLLTATGVVRMVKAGVMREAGADVFFVRCHVGHDASVDEMRHALSALTVACRLVGREADVMAVDAAIARAYLEARGWAASTELG